MRHRPGITLLEVLVAIFVMGIGLLSLLVLFPLAALTMQQAIRDDRSAQAAQQANAWAMALGLRIDTAIQPGGTSAPNLPCFVDGIALGTPYPGNTLTFGTFWSSSAPLVSTTLPPISRIYPNAIGWGATSTTAPSPIMGLKHFSLLDDITFFANGSATDPTGTVPFVERAGNYKWAYFLKDAGNNTTTSAPLVDLQVVVYFKRTAQSAETILTPSGTPSASANGIGSNSILISYTPGSIPALRRGSWIFDGGPAGGAPTGFFYRVDDAIDLGVSGGTGTLQLQVEPTIASNIFTSDVLLFLEDVIDVFDQGAQ